MEPDQCRRAGISDGLIRMSVGLESTDEIIDDLLQASSGQHDNLTQAKT
jgi:cystathionine beta-lyase/cystathionine gamma-synthase